MNSFQLTEITPDKIVRIITKLNEKKLTQVNDIPTKFLKYANALIAPILTKICIKCIREGIFPKNLKTSRIIPVYKKNSKYDCTNYRPISILSQLSKIFKKNTCSTNNKLFGKIYRIISVSVWISRKLFHNFYYCGYI